MKKIKTQKRKPPVNRVVFHNTRGMSGPMSQRIGRDTYILSSTYKKFSP